jgi:hypothetical protein
MKTKKINIAACFITFLLACLFIPGLKAQTQAQIENVDFFVEGNKIVITYDIGGSKPEESFNIWIQVKTISGKMLNAKTTTGDIGKGIKGSFLKRIEWDYVTDQVTLDEEITIEVFAALEAATPKTTETKPAETKATEPKATQPAPTTVSGRKIHVGPALLMSAVLPGLGKVYVKGHGANWLWGVIGYGLVTGSVLMNHAAYDNLEKYRNEWDVDVRDDYYSKAQGQAVVSYICVAGAVAIWVSDFISTGVKAGKAKRNQGHVQLNSGFDTYAKVPVVGLTYRF